jgi:hypothetical protein
MGRHESAGSEIELESCAPKDWGVTTQKENKIYVQILNWSATAGS